MENNNKRLSLSERFKSFKAETWIIIVLEILMAGLLGFFDINFWIDIGKGVTFLGEANRAYEIAISIFLLVLFIAMIVVVVYDLFFRNYQKEEKNITPKVLRDGRVIELESEAQIEAKKEKKAEKKNK